MTGRKLTYPDRFIQASTGESVGVFGVEDNLHYIMCVSFKRLSAGPVLVPIPQFYHHVIRRGQNERLGGMHRYTSEKLNQSEQDVQSGL